MTGLLSGGNGQTEGKTCEEAITTAGGGRPLSKNKGKMVAQPRPLWGGGGKKKGRKLIEKRRDKKKSPRQKHQPENTPPGTKSGGRFQVLPQRRPQHRGEKGDGWN